MRTIILIHLFLLQALAGCVDNALPSGCNIVMPTPRVGDSALYQASGLLHTITVEPMGMWKASDSPSQPGNGGQAGLVVLPMGSQLQVTISDGRDRIHADGQAKQAFQVGYRVWSPVERGPLDVADEWLDVFSSRPIQVVQRQTEAYGNQVAHATKLTVDNHPPVLFGSLFWGEKMHAGWTKNIDLQVQMNSPMVPPTAGTLQASLVSAWYESSTCLYSFEVTFNTGEPFYGNRTALVTMDARYTLPTIFEHYKENDAQPRASFQAIAQVIGSGRELAAWTAGVDPYKTLPARASADGMPVGTWGFSTEFEDAKQAALRTPSVSAWLSQHPDASIAFAEHMLGAVIDGLTAGARCTIDDRWRIAWHDVASGNSLPTTITRYREQVPLCSKDLQVSTADLYPVQSSTASVQEPVTVEAMRKAHVAHYGHEPEVVVCRAPPLALCRVGTHASTGDPYASDSGGSAALPKNGLLFGLETGLIHFDWSWGTSAVPPAVAHPQLAPS